MKIGIDVDDVVLDLLDEWCWRIRSNNRHAPQLWPEDLTRWEIWEDFGLEESEVFRHLTPDIYKDVQAFKNVEDVLDEIEALGHEVVFVTSCMTAEMYHAKVMRLEELGLLKARHIIPVGPWAEYATKAAVPVDWLVDDHIGNVEDFPGHALLVTRPHNQRLQSLRKRIKKLGDVVKELESLQAPANRELHVAEALDELTALGQEMQPEFYAANVEVSTKPTNPKDAIGSDKMPLHLWPETATAMGALGFLEGALKYGRSNFRAIGVRSSIYVDAAKRHLNKWFEGEDVDPESGLPHLAHALACIAIIVDAQAAGKLNDDRQVQGGYTQLLQELTPHVKRLKEKYADKAPKHYTIADKVA